MSEVVAIEAALFSAGRPLTINELSEATGIKINECKKAIEDLISAYIEREGALEVVRLGSKYALQLKKEAATYGRKLAPREVPSYLLKTLALIAHEQPMLQTELKRHLGSKIYEHLRELEEFGMIVRERIGRTYTLKTTESFLNYFGIDANEETDIKKYLEGAVSESI